MSEYMAEIVWRRGTQNFLDNQYSRAHDWHFDGGVTIPASSSPQVVPEPYSVAANVDPEEAFVASIASCHMLFFLSLAAKKKWLVDEYRDTPIGIMERDEEGATAITQVRLSPRLNIANQNSPDHAAISALHDEAHKLCFIANSVKSEIIIVSE